DGAVRAADTHVVHGSGDVAVAAFLRHAAGCGLLRWMVMDDRVAFPGRILDVDREERPGDVGRTTRAAAGAVLALRGAGLRGRMPAIRRESSATLGRGRRVRCAATESDVLVRRE